MTGRRLFLPFSLAGIALLTVSFSGCGADVKVDPVQIQLAVYPQECLDVLDASTAPGQYLILFDCGPGKLSQEWMITPISGTQAFTVTNENSKLCMSVLSGYDTDPGDVVVQTTCNSADPDMQWQVEPSPSGQAGWRFVNIASGECLDDPYGETDPPDTTHMQQYYCTTDDPAQGWSNNPVQLGDIP